MALNWLYCSIRSRAVVNFVDVCGFNTCRGSPELPQVRLLVRFSRRRLRFSLRTHTSVLLYSNTICCPGDNCISLGRTDASRQNSTATNARSMSYGYTGLCCTKRLAEFNARHVKAFVVLNSWSRRYSPQMWENLLPVRIIRRQEALHQKILVQTTRFAVLWGGCTWTRVSRQHIIAITWHVSQLTLLEPLTVTGASAFCFGERYRDVLSQSLDENNNIQTSTDSCTVILRI